MGIAAPLSHLIHAEPTVTSMIVLIGMAVGVDYSLFYLKREREERATGRTTLDAVEIAAARPRATRSWSPGAAVIASMAGPVPGRRRDLRLPRARRDRRGRRRGHRLDHGAARAAGQARPLGRPPAGPAAVAAQPSDRPGRDQPPHPGSRRTPTRSPPWSSSVAVAGRPRRPGPGHEDPRRQPRHAAPRRSRRCRPCTRWPHEFPAEGTTADRGRPRRRRRAGRGRAALGTLETLPPRRLRRSPGGRGAIETSADGTTSRLTLPMPFAESDDRGRRGASTSCATTWCPAALDGLGVEHAVGGDVAESLDFADHQLEPAAAGDRVRAAADPGDDGDRVPQRRRSRCSRPR